MSGLEQQLQPPKPARPDNPKPIAWERLTDAQRRRAECLLIANYVFRAAGPDFRYRVARWVASGRDLGMPS